MQHIFIEYGKNNTDIALKLFVTRAAHLGKCMRIGPNQSALFLEFSAFRIADNAVQTPARFSSQSHFTAPKKL